MEYKRLKEYIDFNPRVKLNKGEFYPCIDMEKIIVGVKKANDTDIDIYNGQSCSKFQKNDTLMARITPCLENGKIAKYTNETTGFGSTELFVLRAKKDLANEDYVYYLATTQYVRDLATNSMTGASGRQRADAKFISNIKWNFPDLDIQNKIASILSAYDELIENNDKRIKILEQMAENLYKEWFVRFRFPGYENAEFENGIPKGWEYKKLINIVSFVRGISYSSEEIDCEDGLNLINLKNIQSYGGFRKDGTKKYSGKYRDSQIVKKTDLIMGITDMTQDRRTVGSVALIPHIDGESVISADLVKVISKIDNIFIYCMCRYGFYSRFFSLFANGANVLHLKPDSLLNKKVLLPTEKIIKQFVAIVSPIIQMIDELNIAIDNATKQRDLLLPRLMSGKLAVMQGTADEPKAKIISFEEFVSKMGLAARAKSISDSDLRAMSVAYIDDDATE